MKPRDAKLICPFLVGLFVLVGSVFAAFFEDFKIGESVEVRKYGNPGDAWNQKDTFPGKIVAIKANEPRYQVRVTTAVSGGNTAWFYSWNVRRGQKASIDEYTAEFLIGAWNVGPGTSENTVGTHDNGDGTRTNTIERGMIGNNNLLRINSNKTYSWQVSSRETITGNWVESDDPDYPITLLDAHWGEDWQAGPDGTHRGKQHIKLRNVVSKKRFWGPRLGATAESATKRGSASRNPTENTSRRSSANTNSTPNAGRSNSGSAGSIRFGIGDRVQAQSRDGKWYNGTISEIDGKRYQIRYDDNYPYALEWVTAVRAAQ
ncbi:MAG: tudor domain-containing protein [Acidobacteriota bacterium]|nr:tudor domain-containing protein [Acidobacteriota bacterium]